MKKQLILALAILFVASLCRAEDVERSLPAKDVAPGAVALEWTAESETTLSGYYLRMGNCLPPRDDSIVAMLFVKGERVGRTVEIPRFEYPMKISARPYGFGSTTFPPVDVGREYRRAIEPIQLKPGDEVKVVVASCGAKVRTDVVAGLQFQGKFDLSSLRAPFRECRTNGPVCSIPWSEPEIVAVGSGEKFDPLCAPQNNSSVIGDKDGTVYIFCAYYSVDEQYGGGRGGSFSRIFGYKKAPGADAWEPLGVVVDLNEGESYAGDPFVFRDLDGTPCILYTSLDGNDFSQWTVLQTRIVRSKTDSFAGPWEEEPLVLWKDYPQYPDDNTTAGRANCVRVFPREKTRDYLVVWNHGSLDMDIRALVVKDLADTIPNDAISSAPVFVHNQEEGGGGFALGDKGYYSTWQIPWLNDPNGQQRLYEIDLNDPLVPTSWRVVPGSIGSNDGANPKRDGGTTADAWAISVVDDRVWATSCEFSDSENKNYLYARSAPVEEFERFIAGERAKNVVFRYGAVSVGPDAYRETFPTIERALGRNCSLELTFRSFGEKSYAFIILGSSDAPRSARSVQLEVNSDGTRFVAFKNDEPRIVLAEVPEPKWEPGKSYRLKLVRDGATLTGYVDGKEALSTTIDNPELLKYLDDEPRFKLYGWQRGSYEISDAILVDGKE
ncbi:MAG: hypothetical protein IJM30_11315 [Thermoguttaceae bacterium]|nr:hypothetical protein [Thermoguttaceae bacterium]